MSLLIYKKDKRGSKIKNTGDYMQSKPQPCYVCMNNVKTIVQDEKGERLVVAVTIIRIQINKKENYDFVFFPTLGFYERIERIPIDQLNFFRIPRTKPEDLFGCSNCRDKLRKHFQECKRNIFKFYFIKYNKTFTFNEQGKGKPTMELISPNKLHPNKGNQI